MNGSDQDNNGMTPATALKVEYGIIGLGVLALLMIFQPFNIMFFAVGCVLVVFAALINNLLPLVQPGVPARSVVTAAMIVGMIFCIVLLVSIFAAYLYGAFFLRPPDPNTMAGKVQLNAVPWYLHSFTWTIAAVGCVLAGLIALQGRRGN
jgi:hypothetical protein